MFILIATALVIAFVPGRWPPTLAVAMLLFLSIGGLSSGSFRTRLADVSQVGPFASTALQALCLLVGLVIGVVVRVRMLGDVHRTRSAGGRRT